MCNTHMNQHAIEAKVLLGERLALETCLQQWKWKPCDGACGIFTEEKGVRGLFHAWNLLKSLEVDIYLYIYAYLCIYTRQFKSKDDRDKRTMIGPDKEFKLCDVETQHAGLVCSSYKWLGCAEHPTRSGGCSCHPGIFADRKKQPFVGGTCFFDCVFFSQKLCRVLYMSWMRRRLWFDHKYPWILWCAMAMATCTWYIRGVK